MTSTEIVQRSARLTGRIERLEGLLPKTKAVCDTTLKKFEWKVRRKYELLSVFCTRSLARNTQNTHRVLTPPLSGTKWTKKVRVEDSQLFTKQSVPQSLQRVYESVPAIPPLHLMDKNRDDGQPCMKV